MRVALLTYSTRPRGGVVHTLSLAEALARQGVDVTVWSLARGGDPDFFRPVDPAVELRLVPFRDRQGEEVGPRILRSITLLRSAFGAGGYDIVHAQDCISANAVGPLVPGGCVRTVHHLDTFTTPELAACHERAIVEPRRHVCVSQAVAEELRTGWGIGATVIPNGVDAARFEAAATQDPLAVQARDRWRKRLGRYVLAVGGIEPRKGTLDLVEAFALLRSRVTDLALVVAGGETLFDYRGYRAEVEQRALELGVDLQVLGAVPHDDLPALVAAAGAFAFPSTKEGFGLAAMEALAAGVPLVTRDLPVLREVFGGAAAFATTAGSLADALGDAISGGGRQRTQTGRALARSHCWDAAARAHLPLYRSL